jgi:hypothetical protein
MKAEPERFEDSRTAVSRGVRTFLVTPLLREDLPIGLIASRRMEVKPKNAARLCDAIDGVIGRPEPKTV